MSHNDRDVSSSVFPYVETVIIALHQLMAELRPFGKWVDASDDRNLKLLQLLSRHMGKEQSKLEHIIAQIENKLLKEKRPDLH